MLTIDTTIRRNLQTYASKFQETKDFAWLIRYAQEEALAKQVVKSNRLYEPVVVEDLLEAIQTPENFQHRDPIQQALNQATADALYGLWKGLEPEAEVLTTPAATSPKKGFGAFLWPSGKALAAAGEAIKVSLRKNQDLDGRQKEELFQAFDQKGAIERAIDSVMTLLYLAVFQANLWKNPILMFLPDDRVRELTKTAGFRLVKQAAQLENKGPRLSDLVHALKIVSGKYANEAILARRKLEDAFTTKPQKLALERRLVVLTRFLTVLDGYIDYLGRAQKAVAGVISQNPEAAWWKYSPDGPFITPDPFIGAGSRVPAEWKELVRPAIHQGFTDTSGNLRFKFEIELWDGTKETITKFQANQSAIASQFAKHIANQPGYADQIANRMRPNIEFYKEFSAQNNIDKRALQLKEVFTNLSDQSVMKLYQDILDHLSMARIEPDPSAWIEADWDIEEVMELQQLQPSHDTGKALRQHQQAQEESFRSAKAGIISRFQSSATLQGELYIERMNSLLDEIVQNDVPSAAPSDVRELKKLEYGLPASGLPKPVNIALKEMFPDVQEVMGSDDFARRYVSNEHNLAEYEKEHKEKPSPILTSIAEGMERIRTSPALQAKLGITEITASQHREFMNQFDQMLEKVLNRPAPEMKKMLGAIPLDSLYAYLADLYTTRLEPYLVCRLACRWTKAVSEKSFDEAPLTDDEEEAAPKVSSKGGHIDCPCSKNEPASPAAVVEAQNFVRQKLKEVKIGKTKIPNLDTDLQSKTAAVRLAHWHQLGNIGMGEEGKRSSFSKVFLPHAQLGFGAHLRDATRGKVRDFLEENKLASDEMSDKVKWDTRSRPRNGAELAEAVGAFADPIPGKTKEGGGPPKFTRDSLAIQPGQRFEEDKLEEGLPRPDSVYKAMDRAIWQNLNIGGTFKSPITTLQKAFAKRREEILEIDPNYKDDIIPFTKSIKGTADPFLHPGLYASSLPAKPPEAPTFPTTKPQSAIPAPIDLGQEILQPRPLPGVPVQVPEAIPTQPAQPKKPPEIVAVEALGTSLKQLELANSEEIGETPEAIGIQITRWKELRRLVLLQFEKHKGEIARMPKIKELSQYVQGWLKKLDQQFVNAQEQLRKLKQQAAPKARRPLIPSIQKILQVAQEDNWEEGLVFELQHLLNSLVDGRQEDLVHPALVETAHRALRAHLVGDPNTPGIEQLRALDPEGRARLPKNYQRRWFDNLKEQLEPTRQGWAHYIETPEEDEPESEFHEIVPSEPTVVEEEQQQKPARLPSTILRRR